MRGLTLLTATILTFGYGFAAQAAMTVERAKAYARVARTVETVSPVTDANRVWYGGMLDPITIEASAPPAKCTVALILASPPAQFRRAVAYLGETCKIEGAYQLLIMDMSLDQSATPARRFWRTWRREIVRGGVLFGLVVGTGLFIRSIRIHVPTPLGALGSFGDFNWGGGDGGDLFGSNREVGDAWDYQALLKPNQRVWIRNTNGPIEVVAGTGDSLRIHVEKSWRQSDPQSVQVVPVLTERGLTVCALWDARDRRCNEGGDYRMNGVKKNDVAVRFTVQLPRNIGVDASTVNGGLQIDGVSSAVEAATVNGRIDVNTSTGPVQAKTINGSIAANMQSLTSGDVRLETVNGSVSAGLPLRLNANIDAQTVNGRVETDFPVKIMGKISPRHLRGTIGNGGPTLKLVTVNGSITLHEADPNPNPNPPAHPRPAPNAPRRWHMRTTPPDHRP